MDIAYNKVDQTALPIDTTRVSTSEYNQIAGSLMNIITSAGLTPEAANNGQLLNALKAMGSGWAMPSDTYTDLTLGASGSVYTAPANGWYCFYAIKSTAGFTYLENTMTGFRIETRVTIPNVGCGCYIPVRKNDVIICYYDGVNSNPMWRFYYAEGSKSEAN